MKLQYLHFTDEKKNKHVLLKVIMLLFLTGDSEHVPRIESTSHESELEDDENDLLFSGNEEKFEENVAGSSLRLPNEEVNF